MFDYQRMFHVGVRVPNIEAAMDELSLSLGLRWSSVQRRDQKVWLPRQGATSLDLKFTYSAEGPERIELLQGPRRSIWDGNDAPGVHHLGVWVDDVADETERFLKEGWTLEIAQVAPQDGYGAFTYVRSPNGILVEPVSSALKPMFEGWWAGGDLA
jgi:catechol 2,3-dioxygenase-like lactoylglutathione lyase family enzyme